MKSKINLLSRVNPTNGPTVCRRSTDGQSQRQYSVGLTKLLCTLTLLLTLGVGQMWAYWYVPGTINGTRWGTTDNNMGGDNTIIFYAVPAGTYSFQLTNGKDWGGNGCIESISGATKGTNGNNATITTTSVKDIKIQVTNESTWKVTVTASDPTYHIKYQFGGSWDIKTLINNGDGTYSCNGNYSGSSSSGFNYIKVSSEGDDFMNWTTSGITRENSPSSTSDKCIFTFKPSDNTLKIRKCNTVTKTNYIYFYNRHSWSDSYIYFVIGHPEYSATYRVTNIANTKLYYVANSSDNWTDAGYYGMIGAGSTFGSGSWGQSNMTAATHYTAAYTTAKNLASGKTILVKPNSTNSNGLAMTFSSDMSSYTGLNYSQTVQKRTCTGANDPSAVANFTQTEVNSGTVTISAYKMTGNGTASNTSNSATLDEASETSASVDAAYSGKVTYTASANTGYTFVGWATTALGSITSSSASYDRYPTESGTVFARFKENQYTAYVQTYTHGSSPSPSSSTSMGQITGGSISVTPNTGYRFVNWTLNSGSGSFADATSASTTFYPTSNSQLRANIVAKTYNIRLHGNGGSDGSVTATFNSSELADMSDASYAGHSLKGYYTAKSGGTQIIDKNGALVSSTVAGYLSSGVWVGDTVTVLYAQWTEDLTYYDVTFGVGTSYTSLGSISATNNSTSSAISSGDDLVSGTSVTFTASPNTGYTVEGWYTDAACTTGKHDAGSTTYTIASLSSAVTVYVKFVEKTWSVAFAAGTGGTVTTPAATPQTVGQVTGISIAATPSTGYTFNRWTSSSGGSFTSVVTTNSNTFKPTANTTVTASFTETMRTITINGGTVASTTAGVVTKGTATAADPATGKKFTGWTLGDGVSLAGGYALTDKTIKFTATQASSVTANYADRAQVKMYFAKPTSLSWSTVYAYAWMNSDDSKKNATWPGVSLATTETINCVTYYVYQYYTEGDGIGGAATGSSEWDRIIFSDNGDGSRKTGDLAISNGHYYYNYSTTTGSASAITNIWYVKGDMNSWGDTDPLTTNCAANTASGNITLTAGNQGFKIYNAIENTWWTTEATLSSTTAATNMASSGSDMTLNAIAGTYNFTVSNTNTTTPRLAVVFPTALSIYRSDPNDATNVRDHQWATHVGNEYTWGLDLEANTTYEFKINQEGAYYGNNTEIKTSFSNRAFATGTNDTKLVTKSAGRFNFIWNSSNHQLTLQYPKSAVISASPVSVYSGDNTTLTAHASELGSGTKSVKYEIFKGTTLTDEYRVGNAVTHASVSATYEDVPFENVPITFDGNATSQVYTVKITVNNSEVATNTVTVYRKWDIYVHDVASWGGMYNHMWGNGETTWPGNTCSLYNGSSSWYTVTIDAKYPHFQLNCNECTGNMRTFGGEGAYTPDITTFTPGSYWYTQWDNTGGDGNEYYVLTSITLTDPTVTLTDFEIISTTQIYVKGNIINCGNDGSYASDMLEVGFKIGANTYSTTCTSGTTFERYITGLTANTSYTVSAYATNMHGTGESDTQTKSTRATGSYTIKVRTGVNDPVPYIYAWVWSDGGCGGSNTTPNAAYPGVAMTADVTGTVYKWYSYTMSNEYNKFLITEQTNPDDHRTLDWNAPLADDCYWYNRGNAEGSRLGKMSCPYLTPQLMINTVAAPETFTYYEMSGSGTITKTLNLAAAGTYQFKIVYNSEWYGSTSTIARTGSTTSNSLDDLAVATENNIQLTADYAGNYTFSYNTSNNTLTVTYPTAYTITYGVGTNEGSNTDISVSPSFTSGAYVLPETDVTFSKGSTKDGYTWKGWYSDVDGTTGLYSSTDANVTLTATRDADINVYACYNLISYTITYHTNGGEFDPEPATTYYITDAVTLPTPTKAGNLFAGWYTDEGLTTRATNISVGTTGNKEYWAKWEETGSYYIYYYNKDSWANVKAHIWEYASLEEISAYPGEAMSAYKDKVYRLDYTLTTIPYDMVTFNNGLSGGDERKTEELQIADGLLGNKWFYNPNQAEINSGSIHHGWTQYLLVENFPTETQEALLGEKKIVEPFVVWAEGISFSDLTITATRTSGSSNVNVVVAGTKLMISGTAAGTATFNITYSYSTTTITKSLTVTIIDAVTVQAKIAKDDSHWTDINKVKIHYWDAGSATNGEITMSWIKEDENYNYFQAYVPKYNGEANFLFYYDYMEDTDANRWRQTADQTKITGTKCYTISYASGTNVKSNCTSENGLCAESWQIRIVMGSGSDFTSNIVGTSEEIVSFFAPSNANEALSYRQGTVTLEQNGTTVHTYPANTFSASGVYTAKINTSDYSLTDLALYDGNYYIRTDGATGGWNDYKTEENNIMIKFNRNANFPNESFSYYWVSNIAKTGNVNIKATVANDYNPSLTNFTADETVNQTYNGVNLRFGYEPTTNDVVRGLLLGSSENNYLNLVGATGNIYKDAECTSDLMDETYYSEHTSYCKLQDKSNWVYEIIVYANIDNSHKTADVYLKSYYGTIQYLLGMVKDTRSGLDTDEPIEFPVIREDTETSNGIYGLRVIYDFKTNRLLAAWAPVDRVIDGILNVDADVMFLRHENEDAAQIGFNTAGGSSPDKVTGLQKAIFALEIENDKDKSLKNRELHYFISLPFDCNIKDIFGIGGFMTYWGIQRYDGEERAAKGWFKDTPTFWKWLYENDVMHAGEGYLLSIDKKALQDHDQWKTVNYQEKVEDEWVDREQSILTLYFPSTSSGFEIAPAATGKQTITYPNQVCTITRDDRDQKDSNWKCIGTPGYKNMTITSISPEDNPIPPVWNNNTPPNFLYVFSEKYEVDDEKTYKKGDYEVTSGSGFTYKSFNSYMVQYAGTIDWGSYSKDSRTPAAIAARRSKSEESKLTKVQIDLLSEEEESLDRTFVWLQEQATDGFDQNYDLNKMVESKANQIYSIALTDIPFAANVLPLETDTVPLVVNIVNAGEYTFALDKDKHIGQAPILYDMFEGEQTNLLDANYTVELEKGKHEGRFYLLFSPVKPIVTSFETTEDGGLKNHGSEAIYDVLGRRVSTIYPEHLYIVNGEKRIAR